MYVEPVLRMITVRMLLKKLVEEGSDGRIKVEVYAGDMTTDEVECVEMVQNNNLEIGWVGTGALGGFVPRFRHFELPFPV